MPRVPATGSLSCRRCNRPMVFDPVARALQCPSHGVLVAQIVRHPLWEGEIVEVLHPSHAERARYVVRFGDHKRRTVWFGHLLPLSMRAMA